MNKIIIVLLIFVIGVGSFFAGVQYQKSQPEVGQPMAEKRPRFRERPQGQGGAISGEIIDSDEKSITVKLPDGGSKIVLISENTAINKAAEGSVDDLETGEQVMVFGQANADGSITANSIQIGRPEFR